MYSLKTDLFYTVRQQRSIYIPGYRTIDTVKRSNLRQNNLPFLLTLPHGNRSLLKMYVIVAFKIQKHFRQNGLYVSYHSKYRFPNARSCRQSW